MSWCEASAASTRRRMKYFGFFAWRLHVNRMRRFFGVILLLGGFVLTSQDTRAQSNLTFRVMTWNIHHGEGVDGREDLQRIANLIRVEEADVVALQEVDKGVERTQRRDLPTELAKLTKMSVVFSNNYSFQGGEYGNAVLTRFPILGATNLHYPKVHESEQRGLLQVIVDVHGERVCVFNTHTDYRPADAARWSNVEVIEKVVETNKSAPVILCGDFNTAPHGRVYAPPFANV